MKRLAALLLIACTPAAAQSVYVNDVHDLQRAMMADLATCEDKGRFVGQVVQQLQVGMPQHLAQLASGGLLHPGWREKAARSIYAQTDFAVISPWQAQVEATAICKRKVVDTVKAFTMGRPWASIQASDVVEHEDRSAIACRAGASLGCADQEGARNDARAMGWCKIVTRARGKWVPCEDMK